ncbi:Retrovirus-related Pol polyprotein from transposon 297 [Merluccius polli]|uniref:Retrovirus-related Pol polyprotein from transposon 297 n=1 Tax=Merluccius polli TaxID=89951 RepID=A0AA47P0L8_MERPO|nr:Retrovirus-related Pol polyprotein from transposon 297 [Merluccius polli]
MVGFYQQFFEGYSSISKPLFALTSGMRKPRHAKGKRNAPVSRKLTSDDWTLECSGAFRTLKQALLDNVTLAHPDFSKPFLLSVDASSNGLGAVLSQLADPLTYILCKPKLDVCEHRWVAKLAPYDFEIKYIPGPKNVVADALSREPFVQPSLLHRLTKVPYGALLEEANVLDSLCAGCFSLVL